MGDYNDSWSKIKGFLKQRSVLDQILEFDASVVTKKQRNDAIKIIKKNPNSFDKTGIYKVSQAAGPVAMYVLALIKLSEVMLTLKPLQKQLDEVDAKLSNSRIKLAQCQKKVKELDEDVAKYKEEFS
jgi:dynein heavy chain 2